MTAAAQSELDGFVIVQPGAPPTFLYWTFAPTAANAWVRHGATDATKRQRWMNKGYHIARARLSVLVEAEAT